MANTKIRRKITRRRPPQFELIAGAVCLDFINTLDDRFSDKPKELLANYGDLARFAEDAGILPLGEFDLLEPGFGSSAAAQTHYYAIEMREAMARVFSAIVNKKPVPPKVLDALNGFLQEAAQHWRLVQQNGGFEWRFDARPTRFDAPLWPIARSAADLLASEHVAYVRACASDTCRWFFLDTSKNHRRRWCDMTKCGNRAKSQRFYSRRSSGRKKRSG